MIVCSTPVLILLLFIFGQTHVAMTMTSSYNWKAYVNGILLANASFGAWARPTKAIAFIGASRLVLRGQYGFKVAKSRLHCFFCGQL